MKVVCSICKQPIEIADAMPPQIVNKASVSLVIVEHPGQTLCPNCNVMVTAAVAQAQIAVIAVAVPTQAQQPIILAPNGLRIN